MRKVLPILAALVVVLVAAVPAVAQDESTDLGPPFDEAPGKDPEEEPLPEAPPEATVPEVPPDVLPEVGDQGSDIITDPETGPSDGLRIGRPDELDIGPLTDNVGPGPGDVPGRGPSEVTVESPDDDMQTGPIEAPDHDTDEREDVDEDVDEEDADDTPPILDGEVSSLNSNVAHGPDDRASDNDEIGDDDEVDAEAREDRIADRVLADLKDGKKDEDDEDEDDDDEDDANEEDVEQSQDQDADSGDVDQDADVINTGDNVNQCVGILQVANTGNAQNATGVTQYDSEADEIELEDGSQITLTPQLVVDCRQIILQIVRGERPNKSELSRARLREVIRPTSGAALANRTGAGVVVPSGRSGITATPKVLSASSAGRPAGQQLKTSARSLPRTGGSYATLVGLGTGVLLVGGGLLVRRLAR